LKRFVDHLLQQHSKTITEIIQRDKTRPSLVMWSIANEPHSDDSGAQEYFKKVAAPTKTLGNARPITEIINIDSSKDKM